MGGVGVKEINNGTAARASLWTVAYKNGSIKQHGRSI